MNTDSFGGYQCTDEKFEPIKNPKNKISCRRNCICYRVTCILCLEAGRLADVTHDLATMVSQQNTCTVERKNTSLDSKSGKIRAESAFFKHLMSCHGGKSDKSFSDYIEICTNNDGIQDTFHNAGRRGYANLHPQALKFKK